jgi:hypothetical protein
VIKWASFDKLRMSGERKIPLNLPHYGTFFDKLRMSGWP